MSKVAIVVSHPIQHFCPQYLSWSKLKDLSIKVFFASSRGLTPYQDKDFGREIKWDNLSLDFPHEFLPGSESVKIGPGVDCRELSVSLDGFDPDFLVVYGYTQRLQRRAIRWGRLRQVPIAMIGDSELRHRRSWPRRFIKKFYLKRLFKKIDIFLSVGDANESYYRYYGGKDTRFVRNFFPIDVSVFDEVQFPGSDARKQLRRKLGIPQENIVILNVGKLVSWKRQRDLVEFSKLTRTTEFGVTVIFAGTGPDEELLREYARDGGGEGVIFAGFISPSILPEYYAAADIYVHCADVEPHSLAVSEAVYSGLPVVLSDRCGSYGPSDDLRPGLNGLVYRCGDLEEMAAAILIIARDGKLRAQMGGESRRIGIANQELAHGKGLRQAISLLRFRTGTNVRLSSERG